MKKTKLVLLFLLPVSLMAQNLQVHYDFEREHLTSTLEMFKPDKWGNTFFFVDFDYNYGKEKHPSLAYMEIARCLKFWNGPLSAHVEYNGGLLYGGDSLYVDKKNGNDVNVANFFPINNAWLAGVDYGMHNDDFTKTLNLKALYKHIVGKQESAQFTAVWGLHFLKRKVSFTGFADFWLEDNNNMNGSTTSTVFISEPQLWYNFNEHLSAGGEVELSSNFGGTEGFKVRPTLALKWNF